MNATSQTKTLNPFAAWLATLPEHNRHPPSVMGPGHHATYWMAAIAKSCLQQKMPAPERLRFSELLDGYSSVIPAGAIALIQPAGAAEFELFDAACKAIGNSRKDPEARDRAASAAFDVLASPRMFDLLIAANPSVLNALRFEVEQRKSGRGPLDHVPDPVNADTTTEVRRRESLALRVSDSARWLDRTRMPTATNAMGFGPAFPDDENNDGRQS
jgi:hypothetical protein